MDADQEKLRRWAAGLAAVAGIMVGILSWGNGIRLFWLVLRVMVAFALVYGLAWGSIMLFFKNGVPVETEEEEQLHTSTTGSGRVLDVAVGADDEGELPPIPLPGQVNAGLSEGLTDSAQQAEIVRRMGWGGK